MQMKCRNPYLAAILSSITFGLYNIYWVNVTKKEINKLGGKIPSIILYLIPQPFVYPILNFFNIAHGHYLILDVFILIFPMFFWYKYISNYTIYILGNNSKINKFKWFILTWSLPLTISILTPIFLTAVLLSIFNIKYVLIELLDYLKYLMPDTEVSYLNVFTFLITEWLLFSLIFFILFVPQIIIQHYLNKFKKGIN